MAPPQRFTSAIATKDDFLSKNPNLKELNDSLPPLTTCLDEITSDDEVWLVQCPKSIKLTELESRNIQMPGKSSHNHVECISEEYFKEKSQTLGYKTKENEYKTKTVPVRGRILVRQKIKNVKLEKDYITELTMTRNKPVPFPSGLRERHPLLGADYREKIILDPVVAEKLREPARVNLAEVIEIKDEEQSPRKKVKKEKKRKRNNSEVETIDEVNYIPKTSKKLSKHSNNSVSHDLSWLETFRDATP